MCSKSHSKVVTELGRELRSRGWSPGLSPCTQIPLLPGLQKGISPRGMT